MKSSYIEVEYIRDAVFNASLGSLKQFQTFINREIVSGFGGNA